ncbi:MAG TPA: hypothetical protein PKO06_23290, partial [Candidatus Ozemobacteraceae bacterium]|nr:hypothetical protein [Candidatus Ozemobacteraceae bacterium]
MNKRWLLIGCVFLWCATSTIVCAETTPSQLLLDAGIRHKLQIVAVMPSAGAGDVKEPSASETSTVFDLAKTLGMQVQVKGDLAVFGEKMAGDPNRLGQTLTG